MNIDKILSGHELVAKGITKIEATLPEIGCKETVPNGSWLEQKQIQNAIETRKHLIELPRIEKSGAISHAEWREELMLAEVTRKVGGYWQFLGHNRGKQLYLEPEEALFLMEVNCLHLNCNEIKVSLQQAYTLLLRGKLQILQYKVYASLSRLGFHVYRHEKNDKITSTQQEVSVKNNETNNSTKNHSIINNCEKGNIAMDIEQSEKKNIVTINEPEISSVSNNHVEKSYEIKKIEKLHNRTLKPCNEKNIHKYFENFPDLVDKHIVFIKAPNNIHIPKSINLKKILYSVNLYNIQNKNVRSVSMDTNIYSVSDEVNGIHIRRIRNSNASSSTQWNPSCTSFGFPNQNIQYKHFNYSRSRQQYSQFNFSMLFQKHFVPSWFFTPQLPTLPIHYWENFDNRIKINKYHRKRSRKSSEIKHLEEIKKIASRLKQLILSGNSEEQNTLSLQNLIHTYNTKYKTRLRLNNDFDIIVDENILDTIDLDGDDGPSVKRRRSESIDNKFDDNFNMLKKLALQLKELEKNKKLTTRHKRAFSKVLRKFNESYNEEYYLSKRYELEYRQHIDLSSSDSSNTEDKFIDATKLKSGKKLRNPFNILKRLSEKQNESCSEASTSGNIRVSKVECKEYSQLLLKTFSKGWLPPEDDFGRAEIVTKETVKSELMTMRREQFLFDFLKIQTCKCKNWLDLKKTFFTNIQQAILEFQHSAPKATNHGINPIIKPNDCMDMASTLENLRIIQTAKVCNGECDLTIDFDVYDRSIRNFKKTKRPAPNFRIICIDEKSQMPCGEDISNLHLKYNDNVIIVFAAVGVDSIVYLQINQFDLPVYIPNNT